MTTSERRVRCEHRPHPVRRYVRTPLPARKGGGVREDIQCVCPCEGCGHVFWQAAHEIAE